MKKNIFLFTLFLLLAVHCGAETFSVASIFCDHAVLQQGKNIPIWGEAAPYSSISVEINRISAVCNADQNGKWILFLPSMKAGGPYTITLKNVRRVIQLHDIYIGEVWLASGQSNMAFNMSAERKTKYESEIGKAKYPLIRFYNVPNETASQPLKDMKKSKWQSVSPDNVETLTAIGYYFARELYLDKKVPVGIISASKGASRLEAWMSGDMLKSYPDYKTWYDTFDKDMLHWQKFVYESQLREKQRNEVLLHSACGIKERVFSSDYDDHVWKTINSPINLTTMPLTHPWGVLWLRHSFVMNKNVSLSDSCMLKGDFVYKTLSIWINGQEIYRNKDGIFVMPSSLLKSSNVIAIRLGIEWGTARFETKEHPLNIIDKKGNIVVALSGAWKINEDIEPAVPGDQDYYNTYTVLYNAQIAPIQPYAIKGFLWYQGESNTSQFTRYRQLLPMLINDWRIGFRQGNLPFLVVQLANYMKKTEEPQFSNWAYLREAQAKSTMLPNVGLAVTIDIGEENDIHPKNKLDVSKRLYLQAKRIAYGDSVISSGPEYKGIEIKDDSILVKFNTETERLCTKGNRISAFQIAGRDKIFHRAEARIVGNNKVLVFSSEVKEPIAVRYAWEDNPDANLYNTQWLPVVPFRSDDWDQRIIAKKEKSIALIAQNHQDGLYKLGDKIVMKFYTNQIKQDSITVRTSINFNTTFTKKMKYRGDSLVVMDSLFEKPTSVIIYIQYLDQTVSVGALAGPNQFRTGTARPKDLISYWNKEKKQLHQLPFKVTSHEIYSDEKTTVLDMEINCTSVKPVRGYFARPKTASPHSLPIVIYCHAAGVKGDWCRCSVDNAKKYAKIGKGTLCFDINAHGMLNGQKEDYYDNLENGELKDYPQIGIQNRDSCYFKDMYLRLLRAIDYMTKQPEWDQNRILVIGESQGGGQALVAVGLDHRVSAVFATVPAMCDWGATLVGYKGGWPYPFSKGNKENLCSSVPYYDAAHLVKDSRALFVVEVGLIDTTSPASAVYAALNGVKGRKIVYSVPYRPHQSQRITQQYYMDKWKDEVNKSENEFVIDYLK
jgi:sialate O-acetylesterase